MSHTNLYLEPPFVTLWAEQDAFAAVDALDGKIFRALESRKTFRAEINGQGYFVKIHRGIGWAEIFKNVFSLRRPVLGASNEWTAIRQLTKAGIATMHTAAFGQRGWNPATQRSFIVTEELAPTISLEDFCRDWTERPPPVVFKRALIRRVAEMAKGMHRCGVNHRDFYICHFLLHLDPVPQSSSFRLSIIDLHRAQCRAETPRRWRDKDLAALYFSALEIGLTKRDFLRFLNTYFDAPLRHILTENQRLLTYLCQESIRLQARYKRKFAPQPQ